MKNVLVLIHDDGGQEARYQAALDAARALNGHLTCLDLTVVPLLVGDYATMDPGGLLLAESREGGAANRARLTARLEHEDVPFDWIEAAGFMPGALEEHAALADLIVVSSDDDGDLVPSLTKTVGDLIRHTHKPILAVPHTVRRLKLDGRALVAWDGSPDAEAALQASVPLLALAEHVTLYYADDRSLRVPIEDAAKYLSRHGIEPMIKRASAGLDSAAVVLLTEIALGRHDFVVMGGFGHAPVTEAIFGGTTRALLREAKVPMIITHRR